MKLRIKLNQQSIQEIGAGNRKILTYI